MIKQIGPHRPSRPGTAPAATCGAVVLRLHLPGRHRSTPPPRLLDLPPQRGHRASVPLDGIEIPQRPATAARVYEFNNPNGQAPLLRRLRHLHAPPALLQPDAVVGFNLGCLDGVNPSSWVEVPTQNRVNHPAIGPEPTQSALKPPARRRPVDAAEPGGAGSSRPHRCRADARGRVETAGLPKCWVPTDRVWAHALAPDPTPVGRGVVGFIIHAQQHP